MGMRVVKTAAAVVASIYLAQFFHLTAPFSAAIYAVLGVEVTKKRGIQTSAVRILASLVGLFLAALIFYLLGYYIWAIAVFVLITYSLLAQLKLHNGIVTSTVLMIHLYAAHKLNWHIILNEIYLLLLGLGLATLINLLYMPDINPKLDQARVQLENLLSQIFKEIALHLRDENHIWDGQEILRANEVIEQGSSLAEKAEENKLLNGDVYWRRYFTMRGLQLESTQRMLDLVAQVYQSLPHGASVSTLFEELSEEVKTDYYKGYVENHLIQLKREFKQYPLPVTRDEFEVRSALLQLCEELKNYLSIAKRSKRRKEQ